VDDNPAEAPARVNLGLASLKAKRYDDATKQLGIALDLNPEHKKAMGYLALAFFESGRVEEAREWFAKSGSQQMVAKCDEILRARGVPAARPPPQPAAPSPSAEVEETVATVSAPLDAAAAAMQVGPALVPLAGYAAERLLTEPAADPFASDARTLFVTIRTQILARVDGLNAVRGPVTLGPEMKRFRGRATD